MSLPLIQRETKVNPPALPHVAIGDSVKSQAVEPPKPRWVLLILLASGICLYLQVFILPANPLVAIGDQSIYLHSAQRLYEGQLIYRDYDQFTLPGTDVLYLVLFKIFGIRAWIPQAMLILVGIFSMWLSVAICSKIIRGPAAFLPGLLFLTLPYSSHLDATHHLYSIVAAMSALAVAVEARTNPRMAASGVLWGIGTYFTQSLMLGPLTFSLYLVWENRRNMEPWQRLLRKECWLFICYIFTIATLNAYFVAKVGLNLFLYDTVTFVAKYFSTYKQGGWGTYFVGWPSVREWANWPDLIAWPVIHLLIPLVYILFFLRYYREKRIEPDGTWDRLMLINVTGVCLFLTIASAPAWNRLYAVSHPGLIILVWFLKSPLKVERALLKSLWAIALILAIARPIVSQTRWRASLDLATGRTAFFQRGLYVETQWLLERTRPSDYFFGDQVLCFALELRNPTRVAYVTPYAFTTPEEVADVLESLAIHETRFVSWYPGLDDPTAADGNHLAPLLHYLNRHYHIAKTFPNGHTIWQRNDSRL